MKENAGGCSGGLQAWCRRHNPKKDIIDGTFEIDHSPWLSLLAAGRSVAIRLYSRDKVDPSTEKGLESENAYLIQGKVMLREWLPIADGKMKLPSKITKFKLKFEVERGFGSPGAFAIENNDKHEFFLKSATLQYTIPPSKEEFHFYCRSWVYPMEKTRAKRVFFTNQLYLPNKTPSGLKEFRQKELLKLRGRSKDERKEWDRVYEYDCYNDLGDPDHGRQYARPVLGGSTEYPYPRRLRTGRPPCQNDHLTESRPAGCFQTYVPPDERLSQEKQEELRNNFVDALARFLTPKAEHPLRSYQECPEIVKKIVHFLFPTAFPAGDFRIIQSIVDFFKRNPKSSSDQDTGSSNPIDAILNIFSDKGVKEMDDQVKQKLEKLVPVEIVNEVAANAIKRNPVNSQLPSIIAEDRDAWSENKEFGRQTLAGTNPVRIRRPSSPPNEESSPPDGKNQFEQILNKPEVIQAMYEGEAYILEHYDYLLPYLNMINGKGVCAYATRTLLAKLTSLDILEPVAIELRLPDPNSNMSVVIVSDKYPWELDPNSNMNTVIVPKFENKSDNYPWELYPNSNMNTVIDPKSEKKTENYRWELAKLHVAANDAAYHLLVSHWLHTHAVIEPFIIATRRQLSVMHPIHRLLDPHFKDTLHINALARGIFLNAGGILETTLFTGEFSMQLSSHLYKQWRFKDQALPQDLMNRGMAVKAEVRDRKIVSIKEKPAEEKAENIQGDEGQVERDENLADIEDKVVELDRSYPAGVKLILEDYPFAKDGTEIWDAIETWVTEYCEFFYENNGAVKNDEEIKHWWSEIRNVGHADQKEGWYDLKTREDLIKALATLIWIASGLHAAVNFGQYAYAGWPPNRPMLLRKFFPEKGTQEYEEMVKDPEKFMADALPENFQMAFAIAVMDFLSRHTSDEVYLGQRPPENKWEEDEQVNEKFQEFRKKLTKIEKNILERNKEYRLMNRWGYAKIPYKLLFPDTSKTPSKEKSKLEKTDITGRGIPNSISI